MPLGDILPVAIGIAISPFPIIAVILMLFSPRARSNGPTFLLGWILGLVGVALLSLALANTQDLGTESEPSSLVSLIKLVSGILLLLLALQSWRTRPEPGQEAEMPTWMAGIDAFKPVMALGLGALMSGLNPKNLLLNLTAVSAMAQSGATGITLLVTLVVYVALASATIAVPVLYYWLGGDNAQHTLDSWKAWLAANNAEVMAVLLLILGIQLFGDGLGALIVT